MFTSIDKAIVAVLSGVIYILTWAGVIPPEWVTPETVGAWGAVLTPILVWLVPNK